MSHFLVIVLTDEQDEDEVERLLAPYDEGGEWFKDESRWDWWVVGGRFTGYLDGYEPADDPRNIEACRMCHGLAVRPYPEDTPVEYWHRVHDRAVERGIENGEAVALADRGRQMLSDEQIQPWVVFGGDQDIAATPEDKAKPYHERLEQTISWIEECKGCNSCKGTGQELKWSTQWVEHPGDVGRTEDVLVAMQREDSYPPVAIVTPDGKWHEEGRMGWFGLQFKQDEEGNPPKDERDWRAVARALCEQWPDRVATVIDAHV